MHTSTSYHPGELAAQDKAGTRGAASELAVGMKKSLNFSLNHDVFLAAQSFAVVTNIEANTDNVWVTPLFGKPGDLSAISENEITISSNCIPRADTLCSVCSGSPLSLLGIDLAKRVRHRINGVAIDSTNNSESWLGFRVEEYAPNCPKYINRREIVFDKANADPINVHADRQERNNLSESDGQFIEAMDTLWIGSHAPGIGADTNHRGGRPGFIRVTSSSTLEWPEYRGNGMFFTTGNLESHDRAGVTLVDFETGSMIQLTGRASVDWQHDGSYEGATRVIKFQIEKLVRTDHVTSHRWKRLDYSPYNPDIVGIENSTESRDHDFPTSVRLAKIVKETENVKTFRFVSTRQIPFIPGQYASFEFENVPGSSLSEIRTWTLSETPNSIMGDNTLDITVKRVQHGLITNWLHDHVEVGLEIKLKGVQGEMTPVQQDSKTGIASVPEHLLLLSGGIGITPNIAILRGVGAFVLQEQTSITMIHVERHAQDLLFQNEISRRLHSYPNFNYTNIISSKEGRCSKDTLASLVADAPLQHAYVCGPSLFMSDMTEHLVALGVLSENIHTESFDF